jgi:hypothetical protein
MFLLALLEEDTDKTKGDTDETEEETRDDELSVITISG